MQRGSAETGRERSVNGVTTTIKMQFQQMWPRSQEVTATTDGEKPTGPVLCVPDSSYIRKSGDFSNHVGFLTFDVIYFFIFRVRVSFLDGLRSVNLFWTFVQNQISRTNLQRKAELGGSNPSITVRWELMEEVTLIGNLGPYLKVWMPGRPPALPK